MWPAGIHRLQAERAGRPARSDEGLRPRDEIPRIGRGDLDDEDLVGIDLVVGLRLRLRLGLRLLRLLGLDVDVGEQLDDDPADGRIPGDGHRADPELLGDRRVQRFGVAGRAGRGRNFHLTNAALVHLVEHPIQVLGEHGDLLLLTGHARDPVSFTRLEEEGPFSGLADGAGHEAIRSVIAVHENRHAIQPNAAATEPSGLSRPRPRPPRPPPTGASCWSFVRRPRGFLGRAWRRPDRSPPAELTVTTYGRIGV